MGLSSNRPSNASPAGRPLFLMSRPRDDWAIRGRANVFAEHATASENGPDAADAQRDWDAVAAAIVAAGGDVVAVAGPDPLLTGLPYTAEAGVLGRDKDGLVFVLPNLTPPHRQGEPAVVEAFVRRLGLRTRRIGARFEGQGDVINVGGDVGPGGAPRFVCTSGTGRWARTADDAVDEYAGLLPGPSLHLGFHADPWFHGNTFLGGYRQGARVVVVVCFDALREDGADRLRAFVDSPGVGASVVAITPEQTLTYATNALQVNDTVLAPEGVPGVVVDAWRGLGLDVRFLKMPALFGKGGGAAVCLTNRLWGLSVDDLPADVRADVVMDAAVRTA